MNNIIETEATKYADENNDPKQNLGWEALHSGYIAGANRQPINTEGLKHELTGEMQLFAVDYKFQEQTEKHAAFLLEKYLKRILDIFEPHLRNDTEGQNNLPKPSELKDFLYWVFHTADKIYVSDKLGWRYEAIPEMYLAFKKAGSPKNPTTKP